MGRARVLQEIRTMRFEEVYDRWSEDRLTQCEAADVLGVCERQFRRQCRRYESDGIDGLIDLRIGQVSARRAPVDEVMRLVAQYRDRYVGWTVKHFYSKYREQKGPRSYNFVRLALQREGVVAKAKRRGAHRRKRERKPLVGMMLHQDGSRHEWLRGQQHDLIVTLDDATGAIYSAFLVSEEDTMSSFIEMIPAYSPQARGRSERPFGTLQNRLPKELLDAAITEKAAANRFLKRRFVPAYNREFAVAAAETGSAFVPWLGGNLNDILCLQEERVVRPDNCVAYQNKLLQIPADRHRCHYVKAKVRVHEYSDGTLAVFHGPRCLAHYAANGKELKIKMKAAA